MGRLRRQVVGAQWRRTFRHSRDYLLGRSEFCAAGEGFQWAAEFSRMYFLISDSPTLTVNSRDGLYHRSGSAIYLSDNGLAASASPLLECRE